MSNRFQYTQRPPEVWQQRSEQSAGGFIGFIKDGVKVYASKSGDNLIRPLPPTWAEAKHYGYDVWVHYQIGIQKAALLCPLKMFNRACPICERSAKLDGSGETDSAKKLAAKRRVLVWLIDRKEPGDKPQAWAMPWTVDRDITSSCRDRVTGEIYYVDHPDNGFDVSFEKKGSQINTDYIGVQIARRASAVEDKFLEYAVQNPLPGIILERSYAEMITYLDGTAETQAISNSSGSPAPWQQPSQTQPPSAPPVNYAAAPAPPTQAPWQQPSAPQQVNYPPLSVELCPIFVTWQGQKIGCGFPTGHAGPCDMSRPIVEQPQMQSPPPPPPAPMQREVVREVVQQPQYAPPQQPPVQPAYVPAAVQANPPSAPPADTSRASELRARFGKTS